MAFESIVSKKKKKKKGETEKDSVISMDLMVSDNF